LDAYCRILLLAKQLGNISYFNEEKERELLALKAKWGFADPRNTQEYKNCDICANDIFRESWDSSGVERRAFPAPPAMGPNASSSSSANTSAVASASAALNEERLIQLITEQVMKQLAAGAK
jgi:L-fuculose-phosphate aldolase